MIRNVVLLGFGLSGRQVLARLGFGVAVPYPFPRVRYPNPLAATSQGAGPAVDPFAASSDSGSNPDPLAASSRIKGQRY